MTIHTARVLNFVRCVDYSASKSRATFPVKTREPNEDPNRQKASHKKKERQALMP